MPKRSSSEFLTEINGNINAHPRRHPHLETHPEVQYQLVQICGTHQQFRTLYSRLQRIHPSSFCGSRWRFSPYSDDLTVKNAVRRLAVSHIRLIDWFGVRSGCTVTQNCSRDPSIYPSTTAAHSDCHQHDWWRVLPPPRDSGSVDARTIGAGMHVVSPK